jgi:thiol-disulfide isomerase/thioredoxin
MLEKGDITIEGKATKGEPDQNGVTNYTWDVTVKGSPLTDKFNVYKQRRADLDKLFNDYHEQHAQIIQQVNEARMAKDSAREKQIMETEEYKAFDKAEKDFFAKVEETYKGIVDENKDTYWGPMMAMYLWTYFSAADKPLYDSLSPEAQQSWYGKKMIDEIMPAGDTGQKAKQLTVKGDDGKELTLEDLAQGKKLLLIDFWASWCGPCRKEIPNVKKLYDLYKDKGFEVVSISIDKNEAAWRKALQQEQLQWPNFLDTMGAADAYKVRSIPAMFLIDAEQLTVIESGDNARGEALAQKLAELLGN